MYRIITAAEAAALWRLENSTVRRAIMEGRLHADKSAGTWLISTAEMVRAYGPPQPATGAGIESTVGQTWHVGGDDTPLLDIGRVPGHHGRHVLRGPDGAIMVVGGYWLRPGERLPATRAP